MNTYIKNIRPDLLEEWADSRNFDTITKGSHIKARWKCKKCEHIWVAAIYNRIKGKNCPACAGRVATDKNSLKALCPEICQDWNEKFSPSSLTCGSNKKVSWKCHKCNHKWLAIVADRVRGSGCPACAGQTVTESNRLSRLNPVATMDWDYKKNVKVPSEYTHKSSSIVWWKCHICRYKWSNTISNYTRNGCPKCNGKHIPNDKNDLYSDKFLLKYWASTNPDPKTIHKRSGKMFMWRCRKCSHQWEKSPHGMSHMRGCPNCSPGSKVSKIALKWLNSISKNLIKEFEIKINGKSYFVDGFDFKNNTIYEFLGDYWHGNPETYNPNDLNAHNKKSFGYLLQNTLIRLDTLRKGGFDVKFIWERDFKKRVC